MGPAGMLLPTDMAEFDTVGVVDVAVAGEVLPAVPDVFHRPELVAMVGVGEVVTLEGIPVDCDDYEYKDPRNEFETVDGMPVYYVGDFYDSDCEDPRDIAYEDWVEWCDFNAPDGYCGVFPDDGEARLPVTKCTPVMVVGETTAPVRLQHD